MRRWKLLILPSLLLAMAAGCESSGKQDLERRAQRRHNRRAYEEGALRAGDTAPTFKLASLDGKSETDLASFRGKRPVILFFGSYT